VTDLVTDRPAAVVLVDPTDGPPPSIAAAGDIAELTFVHDDAALGDVLDRVEVVFAWEPRRAWLEQLATDASRLRWIQAASDGVDHVLVAPLVARADVAVTNARGVFEAPIAEWIVGAMLAMSTGLHRSIVDQGARRWGTGRYTERLAGRHLVVVGPGPIGREVATRASALGMTVEAVGRSERDDPIFGRVRGPEGFHDALGRADVVLDALPMTPATSEIFDAAAFAAMRPGTRFINVGRGGTVDEPGLVEALERGHLGGAALDVFATEPLPLEHPFWSLPDVIVSPHACGDVDGWEEAVVAIFVDNLGRFARREPLRNLVDVQAGFGIGDAPA
jgi:phosphoglycerate dehydrogenase-like enzyme